MSLVLVGVQKQGDEVIVQIEDHVLRIPISEQAGIYFVEVMPDADDDDDEEAVPSNAPHLDESGPVGG